MSQEELLGILIEGATLLGGHNELADKAGPIPDIIVLVVLGEI